MAPVQLHIRTVMVAVAVAALVLGLGADPRLGFACLIVCLGLPPVVVARFCWDCVRMRAGWRSFLSIKALLLVASVEVVLAGCAVRAIVGAALD